MKKSWKQIGEHRAWSFLTIPMAAIFLIYVPNRDIWSYALVCIMVLGSLISGITGKTGAQLIIEWRKRKKRGM